VLTELCVGLTPETAVLVLRGAPETVRRIARFAAPFLLPVDRRADEVWVLEVHGRISGTDKLTGEGEEPPHRVSWHPDRRTIVLACQDLDWLPVLAVRYVRTLSRALAVRAGAVPLHGAAIQVDGTGVMLVGRKWAGKTTAALSLSRGAGGRLVSNDDVLLVEGADGWDMVGGPRSVGIRTDSLAQHRPELTRAALAEVARRHPASREDKTFLLVSEVPALGGEVVVQAPADVVVELRSDGAAPARVERLLGDEVTALLAEHLETGADRRRTEFLAAVGGPRPELTEEKLRSLAASLRYYRYTHPIRDWVESFLAFVQFEISAEVMKP
jgi:hypothetical protein